MRHGRKFYVIADIEKLLKKTGRKPREATVVKRVPYPSGDGGNLLRVHLDDGSAWEHRYLKSADPRVRRYGWHLVQYV